jgi:hypothetical protein
VALKYYDRANMVAASAPGTGNFSLGSAVLSYQSFSAAGASDGDTFSYLILDGNNWEYGVGTYNASGPTISRTTITQSSAGGATAINASANAVIMNTLRAEDLSGLGENALASLTDVDITSPANSNVLTYNSGASKWENQPAASGGDWVPLTFTNTTTIFGTSGMYVSDQTFALAVGELLEIEGYVSKTSGANALLGISEDGSTGYVVYNGSGGNCGILYYSGGYGTVISPGAGNWSGIHKLSLSASVVGSSDNAMFGAADGVSLSGTSPDTHSNLVGTVTVYMFTNNEALCAVRARVVTPSVFS